MKKLFIFFCFALQIGCETMAGPCEDAIYNYEFTKISCHKDAVVSYEKIEGQTLVFCRCIRSDQQPKVNVENTEKE